MARGDGQLSHDLLPGEKGPQDACGVFGVWAPGEDVAKLTYYGLYALQHRGQESAGIAQQTAAQQASQDAAVHALAAARAAPAGECTGAPDGAAHPESPAPHRAARRG